MRGLVWFSLFVIGLFGVVVPAAYLYVASGLPQLESEFDVEKHLRLSVEGERMSLKYGQYQERTDIKYARPDFQRLPKELVALFISQLGCPGYFKTPKEDGPRWSWRLLQLAVFGKELPGDGACEAYLADSLAVMVGVRGKFDRAVAAHKIHSALGKDQLVSYFLSAIFFERGVVGVDDASRALFGKEVAALELPQLAELMLALPPGYYYREVKQCQNAALLRINRDVALDQLVAHALLKPEQARQAKQSNVSCVR